MILPPLRGERYSYCDGIIVLQFTEEDLTMKKRTNLLALVLSITAITFTLNGCSSDTGQKKSIAAPGSATETDGGAESNGTNGGGADQASADESINEQVLVDQDGIKITAIEYVTDSIWGDGITSVNQVELKFHIYNAESYDTIADSDAITFTAQ